MYRRVYRSVTHCFSFSFVLSLLFFFLVDSHGLWLLCENDPVIIVCISSLIEVDVAAVIACTFSYSS